MMTLTTTMSQDLSILVWLSRPLQIKGKRVQHLYLNSLRLYLLPMVLQLGLGLQQQQRSLVTLEVHLQEVLERLPGKHTVMLG